MKVSTTAFCVLIGVLLAEFVRAPAQATALSAQISGGSATGS